MKMRVLSVLLAMFLGGYCEAGSKKEKLSGYAEWRMDGLLVVGGQRVQAKSGHKFKGKGRATSFKRIPLGYEVKCQGKRLANGVLLAHKIEAKPNGSALFEGDLKQASDQQEQAYVRAGHMFQQNSKGQKQVIGALKSRGREVERVRRIAARLTPPYLEPEDFRVYVIENKEWNAMAAPNRSIYVFTGLLNDMNDDELAIIIGHELVHSTHEHSRRGFKRSMLLQMGAMGALAASESVDNNTKRQVLQIATMVGASAFANGYGRKHEDEADRVGLRYAAQAGYDVTRGPTLWNRFAQKYGRKNRTANFFFGSHSVAKDRERNLKRELALNYPNAQPRTERRR